MSMPGSSANSNSKVQPRKFTDAQTKFIAEFFVCHYDILRIGGRGWTGNVNKERADLHADLTKELNERWGKQFTVSEVHRKLKNLKSNCKEVLAELDSGLRSLNGADAPDIPQMSEAESIIVQKILSVRNSSTGVYRGESPNLDGLIRVPSPDNESESDGDDDDHVPNEDFLAAQSVQQEFNDDHQPPQIMTSHRPLPPRIPQPIIQPGGLRTLPPIRNEKIRSTPAAPKLIGQKRKLPPPNPVRTQSTVNNNNDGSLKILKRSVLLLHRRVLEGELEHTEHKKMTLVKFNEAIDEFRRYVAEQRMIARGVDISNVPVDIPPGMQGIGIE